MQLSLYIVAFVPLTMEGNIMVDEALASCYASGHYDIVHNTLVFVRYFPELVMWNFGEEDVFSSYIKIIQHFHKWVIANNHLYKWKVRHIFLAVSIVCVNQQILLNGRQLFIIWWVILDF